MGRRRGRGAAVEAGADARGPWLSAGRGHTPPSPRTARASIVQVMPKLDWIVERTQFIDGVLDAFLAEQPGRAQCVLIGSGYDTRAWRYGGSVDVYEVDLPKVVEAKTKMAAALSTPLGGGARASLRADLKEAAGSVVDRLCAAGLRRDAPTLIVVEAVLFYLPPPTKAALLAEFAELIGSAPGSALVLTDNLAPFARSPSREATAAYVDGLGLELIDHSTLWGGAIQFVHARAPAAAP